MGGKLSGRCGYQGQEGRGGWVGRGICRASRGYNYYGDTTKQKGLCSDLGIHVFDYSHKASTDKMRTTWGKLVHYVVSIHENYISFWVMLI